MIERRGIIEPALKLLLDGEVRRLHHRLREGDFALSV